MKTFRISNALGNALVWVCTPIARACAWLDEHAGVSWVSRCLTTTAIGAFFGLLPWIDARMIGPERYAALSDYSISAEYAGSFAWQVGGSAVLFWCFWAIYEVCRWRDRRRRDARSAEYCRSHGERKLRTSKSPEETRQALRLIQGGRP